MNKKVALLTGTINPKKFNTPFTKIINEKERLKQYVDTIKKYLVLSDFEVIIFCENSKYSYNYSELKKIAKKNKKELEILRFLGTGKEMAKRGKGYGEGEIIKYALGKSKFLKDEKQTFYKITGRIFIKNINKILKHSNKENYFFSVGKNHCVTLFFKCSVGFFRKNLMQSYKECDEKNGIYLENVFYKNIINHSDKIHKFIQYPRYVGVSGTNGQNYNNQIKWLIRNMQLKLGMLNLK